MEKGMEKGLENKTEVEVEIGNEKESEFKKRNERPPRKVEKPGSLGERILMLEKYSKNRKKDLDRAYNRIKQLEWDIRDLKKNLNVTPDSSYRYRKDKNTIDAQEVARVPRVRKQKQKRNKCPDCGSFRESITKSGREIDKDARYEAAEGVYYVCPDCNHIYQHQL